MLENQKEYQVVALPTDKSLKLKDLVVDTTKIQGRWGVITDMWKVGGSAWTGGYDCKITMFDKNLSVWSCKQEWLKAHHLYFLSDEDRKEGDWVYHPEVAQEYTIVHGGGVYSKGQHIAKGIYQHKPTTNPWYKKEKKIIATTNPDLWKRMLGNLMNGQPDWSANNVPKIDTTFIEAYVREQGKIDKVLIEIILHGVKYKDLDKGDVYDYSLKLKPNGSVIVHPYKEKTYTAAENEEALRTVWFIRGGDYDGFEEWFSKYYAQ